MTVSRDQLFQTSKPKTLTHNSAVFGGEIKYHLCTVGEKGRARKIATEPEGLNNEILEAALMILCLEEPKLTELDLEAMKALPAGEVATIAGLILGKSPKA